jgi:hypothetical protein
MERPAVLFPPQQILGFAPSKNIPVKGPLEVEGGGELHGPLFTERRTRSFVHCGVAGNPGTLRSE